MAERSAIKFEFFMFSILRRYCSGRDLHSSLPSEFNLRDNGIQIKERVCALNQQQNVNASFSMSLTSRDVIFLFHQLKKKWRWRAGALKCLNIVHHLMTISTLLIYGKKN